MARLIRTKKGLRCYSDAKKRQVKMAACGKKTKRAKKAKR